MRKELDLLSRAALLAGVAGIAAIVTVMACGGISGNADAVQPPGVPVLYGDGSAGALTIAVNTTLTDGNTQYTNVTVNGGATLTVQSGTVIHCTGTFTVNGTVNVSSGGNGGFIEDGNNAVNPTISVNTITPGWRPPTQGQADSPAEFPEVGDTAALCEGGAGGVGQSTESRFIRYPGHNAGGSGSGACGGTGGSGGGGLTVVAFGAISVPGTISANGSNAGGGAGGGAGGVVVLASAVSVTVAGTINANGGDGGDSNTGTGAGGGGGGGIINLLAPTITGAIGVDLIINGGAAGADALNATDDFRSGGGGGGGCGGTGGAGGDVTAADATNAAGAGGAGDVNRITADPTGLFP